MCVVEVKGARSLVAACVYPVNEGMEVFTNTPKVIESRKMTLEMLLSVHNKSCLTCKRSGTCELQALCQRATAWRIPPAMRAPCRIPSMTTAPITSCATIPSASSAAAAWPPARNQHVAVIGPNEPRL